MNYLRVESTKALAAVTVVALFTIGFCQAQSIGLRVNVPFEFRVSDTVLPPGTYEIWRTGSSDALSISDKKGHSAFIITDGTKNRSRNPAGSELLFNVYGDRYFLGEVRWSGYPVARLLPKSKMEIELAKNSTAPSTLSVAAK